MLKKNIYFRKDIIYIYISRQLGVDLRVAKYAKVKTSTSYGFV